MRKITNTDSAPHSCSALRRCVCYLTFPSCPSIANALANATCERCKSGFAATEKIVNSNGELYHEQCFVCAQCFQQFPEGLFYEVGHFRTIRKNNSFIPRNQRHSSFCSLREENTVNMTSRCSLPLAVTSVVSTICLFQFFCFLIVFFYHFLSGLFCYLCIINNLHFTRG